MRMRKVSVNNEIRRRLKKKQINLHLEWVKRSKKVLKRLLNKNKRRLQKL